MSSSSTLKTFYPSSSQIVQSSLSTTDFVAQTQYRPSAQSNQSVAVSELRSFIEEYLYDGELRLQSSRTLETRRVFLKNLLWFLDHNEYSMCGLSELRQFFHYLGHGHEDADGRFGNPNLKRAARPVTVLDYYVCLRSLFDWLVAQKIIDQTPFTRIAKPQVREEVKTPLSFPQFEALLEAAGRSSAPARNRAILALLLDTGCRASELVGLQHKDVDINGGRCRVLGKGNKYRTLFFGSRTAAFLQAYCNEVNNNKMNEGQPDSIRQHRGDTSATPFFRSTRDGQPLTRSGLLHLLKRLGEAAGFKDEVCVHALRRSFAVQMLRNGANVFSVQAMLGHTNLQMTRKYCAMALTDAEAQHRQFSPMDRLGWPLASLRN